MDDDSPTPNATPSLRPDSGGDAEDMLVYRVSKIACVGAAILAIGLVWLGNPYLAVGFGFVSGMQLMSAINERNELLE